MSRGADSVDAPNNYADQPQPNVVLPAEKPAATAAALAPIAAGRAAVQLHANESSAEASELRDDVALLPNEEVQIHLPPPEPIAATDVSIGATMNNGDPTADPAIAEPRPIQKTNTGLSQSDLSISSSCGSNKGYSYGTQQPYTVDAPGYQTTTGKTVSPVSLPLQTTAVLVPPAVPQPENDGQRTTTSKPAAEDAVQCESPAAPPPPVIKAAIYKQTTGAEEPPKSGETNNNAIAESVDVAPDCASSMPPPMSLPTDAAIESGSTPIKLLVAPAAAAAESLIKENGGCGPIENGTDSNGAFDSLMCLPAPPSMDEIQLLNEFVLSESNNMDSLPPPPPLDSLDGGFAVEAGAN